MQIVNVEKIRFSRPSSDNLEVGLRITDFGKSIIIDRDFNIVINCSYEGYAPSDESVSFDLDEWYGEQI